MGLVRMAGVDYGGGRMMLQAQLQEGLPKGWGVLQRLVETAMMAAVGGLAYVLATTLKLEGYMGYFLPLPVVLSGMRAGPTGARKTFTATIFLLLGEPSQPNGPCTNSRPGAAPTCNGDEDWN